MINLLEFIGFVMVFLIVYIFIGYPIILFILNLFMRKSGFKKDSSITPFVSFMISCYNEEKVIKDKLINALAMDYPVDKIEIIVISDCSSDNTDKIVENFSESSIRLLRMEKRQGKTIGLNYAVAQAKGEVIVFSDANSMYEKDAIRKLVRNFSDDQVGYVVGEAKYVIKGDSASVSERTYWYYECSIKKIESRLHSVVGGDGAIYAIRKELYEPLLETDINDFVNPLQIISKGFRGIYEDEAICWEETAGSFEKEFNRKTRIVNRSFSGLLRVASVMNPFKHGFFSFEIISHKLLRWLSPFFLLTLLVVSMALAAYGVLIYKIVLAIELAFISLAYVSYVRPNLLKHFYFYYPYYFVAINIASLTGIFKRIMGHTDVTWNTARTVSEKGVDEETNDSEYIHWAMLIVVIIGSISLTSYSLYEIYDKICRFMFWTSFIMIVYIFVLYPLILQLWYLIQIKRVKVGDILPNVTMLVCAYNEEDVIAEKIENTLAIDYPSDKFTVIIASDGSSDMTNDIVKRYNDPRIHFIPYIERSGKIGAIIKTVPVIKSEIIVFSDANAMIDKDAIKRIVRNFNDPSVGAVSTDVVVLNDKTSYGRSESLYYKYERWIQKKESFINSIIGVDGGLYAIRRELYLQPSHDIILDDFVISMNAARKGHRLIYDEKAKGYEESENSYSTEFSKKSRVVAGAFQALIKREGLPSLKRPQMVFSYISHKLLRWLTPVFMILLYLSSLLLTFETGNSYLIVFTGLQTIFYILACLGLLYRGPIRIPYIYIPFYFCLVNFAALFGIYKGLLNKQSVKWKVFKRKQGDA